MNKFSHLNIHSQYSISDGLVRLDELSSKAKDLNFESIAITDDSNLFGFVKFYKEMRDKGIKPICGVDFDIKVNNGYSNLILLAKNKKGLEKLFKLSTESFVKSGSEKRSIPEQDILNNADDIVCIIPSSSPNLRNLALKKEDLLIDQHLSLIHI